MKFFLWVSLAFAATLYAVSAQHLPEVLIHRARELIHQAEVQLHHHHEMGRQHLTHALEHEIEEVRKLERELLALEHSRHLEIHEVHAIEERLLHHENRLIEELLAVMHAHERERENLHLRGNDHGQ